MNKIILIILTCLSINLQAQHKGFKPSASLGLGARYEFNFLYVNSLYNGQGTSTSFATSGGFGPIVWFEFSPMFEMSFSSQYNTIKSEPKMPKGLSELVEAEINVLQNNLNFHLNFFHEKHRRIRPQFFFGPQINYRISGKETFINAEIKEYKWPTLNVCGQSGLSLKALLSSKFTAYGMVGMRFNLYNKVAYFNTLHQAFAEMGILFKLGNKQSLDNRCPKR